MKVGIISDTHGFLNDRIKAHLGDCDEIWHAGDFGTIAISDELSQLAPVKGVYGNIDGQDVRVVHPEEMLFDCEGLKVYMRHISGYPGRYNPKARKRINELRPDVVVVGHSHICKVMRDQQMNHLHINPGAAGIHGFHQMRTLALMEVKSGKIESMNVVELGLRAKTPD